MPSISIPTAALVGAGVAGVGSVAGAAISAGAARSAAKQQSAAATLASENQLKEFEQVRASLQPFIAGGTGALGEAENLLGLGPSGFDPSKIQAALEATPGYQFTLGQGLKSVQNSYAARGLGSSGAALRGAADYTTGLANMTYEQRLADYLGLAAQGQNAAIGTGQLGLQAQSTASQFATSGAAAGAAGTVGAANALTAGLSGITGSVNNALLLSALSGSGMFGSQGAGTSSLSTAGTALSPGAAALALGTGG